MLKCPLCHSTQISICHDTQEIVCNACGTRSRPLYNMYMSKEAWRGEIAKEEEKPMNNGNEIAKLKQQVAEMNKRIKELEHESIKSGNAALERQSYATDRADEWRIRYKGKDSRVDKWQRYVTLYTAGSKEDAVAYIDTIITDLQGLKEQLQ